MADCPHAVAATPLMAHPVQVSRPGQLVGRLREVVVDREQDGTDPGIEVRVEVAVPDGIVEEVPEGIGR